MTLSEIEHSRYCVHQVTLMEQCDFKASIQAFSGQGIYKTAVWRDKLDAVGAGTGRTILDDYGVSAEALCAGGFFCYRDTRAFKSALDDNRRWIDQAATIGARSLIVITGGLADFESDLQGARLRAVEALGLLGDSAAAAGIRLVLEPLHPMICGSRSVVCTLREANDTLDQLERDDVFGIALDTYATWWDHELEREIQRAGSRIRHFHVSDWLADTTDLRLDRGMPGDGLIDNRRIRGLLEQTGFTGPVEVEIFSARNWWQKPATEVLRTIVERYRDAM
jgi:sugar phosphate isomerase/epimerase